MFPMGQELNQLEMGPSISTRSNMHSLQSSRKQRTVFSPSQLSLLEKWFFDNPFPKGEQRQLMAVQLGISVQHIQVWFQNKRAKEKRKMKKVAELKNKKFIPEPPMGWPKDLPFNTKITDALKSPNQGQFISTCESIHATTSHNCTTKNSAATSASQEEDISGPQQLEDIITSPSEEVIESKEVEAYMPLLPACEFNSEFLSTAEEMFPTSTYPNDPLFDSWNSYGNYLEHNCLPVFSQAPAFPVEQCFGEPSTSCFLPEESIHAHQHATSGSVFHNNLLSMQESQFAYYDGNVVPGYGSGYSSFDYPPPPYFDNSFIDPRIDASQSSGTPQATTMQFKRGKKRCSTLSMSDLDTIS